MRLETSAWVVMLMCAGAGFAAAQETTSTITGRTIDAQGLAVPGVVVTATGPQGAKSATTDSQGRYTFPFVTPGTYTVRSELQGFKTIERKNVTVSLGQTVNVPFKMEVGGITETVNVTAAPPLIDSTSTTAGAVISSDLLERVPVGRRISDTLYLAPGVSGGEVPAAPRGSGIQTVDGFMTRTPFQSDVDIQAAYQIKVGGARRLTVLADIFNLFDRQTVQIYDTWTSLTFGAGPNPNVGEPTSQVIAGPQLQTPRQIRLGARLSF